MAAKRFDPERDLRAWADALSTVADLQHIIVELAEDLTPVEDREWLDFERSIVRGALRTWPDRAKEDDSFESAQGLKRTALEVIAGLQEKIALRRQEAQL